MNIVIVDYGLGNLGSIKNMIKKIGYNAEISSDSNVIMAADKLILAGVGSFDAGILGLNHRNLVDVLNQKVIISKTPILGICLGMQLMTQRSEEGNLNGLGWVDAETIAFPKAELLVPHMGWNYIDHVKDTILFSEIDELVHRYYFVHSYFVDCFDKSIVIAETLYGKSFHSAFQSNNIYGVQFHPEKSHKYGKILLSNFLKYS